MMQASDPESIGMQIGRRFGKTLHHELVILTAAKSDDAKLQ
jgi:hypothetical protein